MDLIKFCSRFRELDFVHSNFKVIQYLRLTIAFKLVLSNSSQILLPLCNPAIPSLAVSCNGLSPAARNTKQVKQANEKFLPTVGFESTTF